MKKIRLRDKYKFYNSTFMALLIILTVTTSIVLINKIQQQGLQCLVTQNQYKNLMRGGDIDGTNIKG